jgi:uncharacterized protein
MTPLHARSCSTVSAQGSIADQDGQGRRHSMSIHQRSPLSIYRDHLERGELAYQFSTAAGKAVFFPRLVCPFTGSDQLEWRISKGLGTVYATTVVHPADGQPYNVVLVDCDEGFRLMSRVEGVAPEAVRIGQRVRFCVHRAGGENHPYPVFMPAEVP